MSIAALSLMSSAELAPIKQAGVATAGVTDKAATAEDGKPTATAEDAKTPGTSTDSLQLSDKAKAIVRSLQARDQQVRAHEQAHLAASGGLATSGASYTYQKGPDGVSYAIGGEVSIDVSPGRSPEDTIARAAIIRAAALAPADPSGQDRAVAAAASQMEQQARAEMLIKASAELKQKVESTYKDAGTAGQGARQDNHQSAGINAYA